MEFKGASKPLDHVKEAGAAYSLRKLNSDYTGYAIQVRNEAEDPLDIGFNSMGSLDTVALLSHADGGNVTVETWYDQSGKERHATQTEPENRPVIVRNGRLVTQNGRPAVEFSSSNENYLNYDGTFFANSPYSVFVAEARANEKENNWVLGGSVADQNKNLSIGYFDSKASLSHYNNSLFSEPLTFEGQTLVQSSYMASASVRNIYQNGISVTNEGEVSLLTENNEAMIGKRVANITTYYDGKVSEIIMYPSYLEDDDRKIVEASQGRYFGVGDMADAFVAKWYDQSGNEGDIVFENEPKIVSTGVMLTENNRPSLNFTQRYDFINSIEDSAAYFGDLAISGNYYIQGDLSEALFYGAALSDTQRQALEASQMHYFNIHRTKETEPYITLNVNGSPRQASYLRGSGSQQLTFRYTVQPGDESPSGIPLDDRIRVDEGSIKNNKGEDVALGMNHVGETTNIVVNGASPIISKVVIPVEGFYGNDATLDFHVRMNEVVFVEEPADGVDYPKIPLNIGGQTRYAEYVEGSETDTLTFRYTVQSGDQSGDGIDVSQSLIEGGVIKDSSGNLFFHQIELPDLIGIVVSGGKIEFMMDYPSVDRISKVRFRLKMKSNEEGKAFYVVLDESATTPSAIQVKEGKDASNQTSIASGFIELLPNEEAETYVSDLNINTNYNVYIVLEDKRGKLQEEVLKLTVKTIDSYLYVGEAPGGDYNIRIEYLDEVSNDEIFGVGGKITQYVNPGGIEMNETPDWIKFDYNGKILYLPKSAIRSHITWDDINKVEAVFGKEITVGNKKYKVRLIKGGESIQLGSEWNDLLYGIHVDTSAVYGWDIDFTNADLNIGTGIGKATWTQDEVINGRKVIRGFLDVTTFGTNSSFNYLKEYGWRPILEEIQ